MSEFNFSSLGNVNAVSSSQARLKPWNIYPVKFAGARIETIQGKKDPTATYTILKVRFDGEDGYYEESIFYPKAGDDVRPTYTSKDGHEYQGASSLDRTMFFIAQVATVLNPTDFAKLQAAVNSGKINTFDQIAKMFVQITDRVKGAETHLKLVGRTRNGNVEAALPKFVAINKEGKPFPCDNFIGDKLFFTAYEEQKQKEFQGAKPTKMESGSASDLGIDSVDDAGDIDFDSLL